ncbi:MAG: NAD-dependent epimerase/dehydratase family protein, partial [Candidatus Omnitrophica bacterium]|nr:NAD-dependent epimerase/dehydratase family protein [Candidatus Omnitrophota bacterium]
MKYIITGVSGFVAGHYIEYILKKNPRDRIVGIDITEPKPEFSRRFHKNKINFHKKSVLEKAWISNLIKSENPDYIVNLASYSSVAASWQ